MWFVEYLCHPKAVTQSTAVSVICLGDYVTVGLVALTVLYGSTTEHLTLHVANKVKFTIQNCKYGVF